VYNDSNTETGCYCSIVVIERLTWHLCHFGAVIQHCSNLLAYSKDGFISNQQRAYRCMYAVAAGVHGAPMLLKYSTFNETDFSVCHAVTNI